MIPRPPILIVVIVVEDVHRNDVPRSGVIPRQAAPIVVDLVVVHIQNGKMTTLKYKRRRTVYRRSGIIGRKMSQIPKVIRMGRDGIEGGPGRVQVADIDLRLEDAPQEIAHQGSKEIGKFF